MIVNQNNQSMTVNDVLVDLYSRFTSRKFILAFVSIGLILFMYHTGSLTSDQVNSQIMAIVLAYLGIEGASDIATTIKQKPQPTTTPELYGIDEELIAKIVAERLEAALKGQTYGTDSNSNSKLTDVQIHETSGEVLSHA